MRNKIKDEKSFEDLLGKKNYDKIWKEADDVIETTKSLEDIYEKVPEHLKGITVKVLEIHIFPEKFKNKINYFLNEEDYPVALDYIED